MSGAPPSGERFVLSMRGLAAMAPARSGPIELYLEDVVRLRKPHPCGSHDWTVTRLGADIGLRCHGCNRRVLLPRRTLEKRLKTFISRGPGYTDALAAAGAAHPLDPAVED